MFSQMSSGLRTRSSDPAVRVPAHSTTESDYRTVYSSLGSLPWGSPGASGCGTHSYESRLTPKWPGLCMAHRRHKYCRLIPYCRLVAGRAAPDARSAKPGTADDAVAELCSTADYSIVARQAWIGAAGQDVGTFEVAELAIVATWSVVGGTSRIPVIPTHAAFTMQMA
jgi:hypothetical protein